MKLIKVISLVCISMACSQLWAEQVTLDEAKTIAVNWMNRQSAGQRLAKSLTKASVRDVILEKDGDKTILYIVPFEEKGFVIVSGDDVFKPIIGYSVGNELTMENLPPNFREYLEKYKLQMKNAIEQNIVTQKQHKAEWDQLKKGALTLQKPYAVDPLMETTWDQGMYYNQHCPEDPAGPDGHALAGCVAVAMAQIMKYYQSPVRGAGQVSYASNYDTLSADLSIAEYDWSDMPNALTDYNDEVAKLIYHCGLSVAMNYGPAASSAGNVWVHKALLEHFTYAIRLSISQRSDYSGTEWNDLLMMEIDNLRPVYYSGADDSAEVAHAWVVDGYDDNNFFHCNWGWGGFADGYFSLDDLTPGSIDFGECQLAIYTIIPTVTIYEDVHWSNEVLITDHTTIASDVTVTIDPGTRVIFDGSFHIDVNGAIHAVGTEQDTIVFTAADTSVGWLGILFMGPGTDSTIFNFCRFEYGKGKQYHDFDWLGNGVIMAHGASNLKVDHCHFYRNTIQEGLGQGAAIYLAGYAKDGILIVSNYTIENCRFEDNHTYNFHGGAIRSQADLTIIKNCTFINNSAGWEGGTYGGEGGAFGGVGDIVLVNNIFRSNRAGSEGGAFKVGHGEIIAVGNLIVENEAKLGGGGVAFDPGSEVYFINNTLIDNHTASGWGGAGLISRSDAFVMRNSILWGNTSNGLERQIEAAGDISHCLIEGGSQDLEDLADYHHIDGRDPLILGSGAHPYQLSDDSPAVNAGIVDTTGLFLPALDLVGNPRIYGGLVDLGAYENQNIMPAVELFLSDSSLSFLINPGETETQTVSIFNVFNLQVPQDSLMGLSAPYSATVENDSLIHITFNPQVQGYSNDTLIVGSVGDGRKTIAVSGYAGFVVSGDVSGTWDVDTVKVKTHIRIPDGETLDIHPGSVVDFCGNFYLEVEGRLLAAGAEQDSIVFTARDAAIGWAGIRFDSTSTANDTSCIQFCIFEKGKLSQVDAHGLISVDAFSKLKIMNSRISQNEARQGIIVLENGSDILISNNFIDGNEGGSAIYSALSKPHIISNIISNNIEKKSWWSEAGGITVKGAIFNREDIDTDAVVINNLIFNNKGTGTGAIIVLYNCNPLIVNNTIVNNYRADGTLSKEKQIYCHDKCNARLINNIIYKDETYDDRFKSVEVNKSAPVFQYNNIHGGYDQFVLTDNDGYEVTYENNIDANPLFKENSYQLYFDSPCVDAGSPDLTDLNLPALDLAGNPRLCFENIDMGAYECASTIPSSVKDRDKLPDQFLLSQNYPNPFNPVTQIKYAIKKKSRVILTVYDILGKEVVTLVNEIQAPGYYDYQWDASDQPSGVYFIRMTAGDFHDMKKCVLMK